ncbi:hypothetical protein BC749_10215 [Flavobacterium araucananum]|uniref:Uncharacterized protein n=1 Tax=Flavobacterium araucananum TaxID=946678 RepID=A0A227NVG7_9FLAO|nr:hypothetical protein [Flavobacterium araucananum]OXG01710.1 hypothetical protein B0A64_18875 [Flavobacterium araucananum]PWK00457.1 hypothetical protein BC749_10215 [Flavobacterium araucananum]
MENFKDVSLDNAIKLINENKSVLKDEIVDELNAFYEVAGKIVLYSGETNLENLIVGNDIVIVNGDLNVANIIEDCDKVDSSLLIVLGNANCKSLITLSSMYFTGDLNATNVILGDSLCDYVLNVGGNIVTKTILDYGHSIIAEKKITATDVFSFNSIEDENGAVEQNMERNELVDEIIDLDDDDKLESLSKTFDYIKDGGEIFKKS